MKKKDKIVPQQLTDQLELATSQGLECYELATQAILQGDEMPTVNGIVKLESIIANTSNPTVKTICYDYLGMMCSEVGAQTSDLSYLDLSLAYYKQVDLAILAGDTKYQSIFRQARTLLYRYKTERSICKLKQIDFPLYDKQIEYLIPSQNLFQTCFREGIIDNNLTSQLTRRYLLSHMALIAAELNRWVEFQYYLDFIPVAQRNSEYHSMRAVTLDAFSDYAHADNYSSLTFEIIGAIQDTLNSPDITPRNRTSITARLTKHQQILAQKFPNSVLHIKTRHPHTKYWSWCLKNHLTLNEHAIYCHCFKAKKDTLRLKTSNAHTRKKWLTKFQLLIEQLKSDYDEARLALFNSLSSSKNLPNSNSHKSFITDKRIRKDRKSRLLVLSFKLTYSILDRVAVSLITIFDEVQDVNLYFHDFIDYVKTKVPIAEKRHLLALQSLAAELYHQNEKAALKEYKDWRNAIEHNFFFVVKSGENIESIKSDYEHLSRVEFADEEIFESRNMHLLQICRSAIFSLVFILRDESCQKFFNH